MKNSSAEVLRALYRRAHEKLLTTDELNALQVAIDTLSETPPDNNRWQRYMEGELLQKSRSES